MEKSISTITPPVKYPIEPTETANWLKLDPSNTSDAVIVDELIATATGMIETYLGRAIMTQTLEMRLHPQIAYTVVAGQRFGGYEALPSEIKLWRPPLVSVTSITAYEQDGTAHVVAPGDYTYDATSRVGRVLLEYGAAWDYYMNGWYVIRYIAGYGATINLIPPEIRHAIRQMVSVLYGSRESGNIQITPEIMTALDEFRIENWEL